MPPEKQRGFVPREQPRKVKVVRLARLKYELFVQARELVAFVQNLLAVDEDCVCIALRQRA
jgi:hypothetical protein